MFFADKKNYPLVFIDVETTGLDPFSGDAICEIGAVKYKQGNPVEEFSSLVNPKRPIPSSVSAIHSIYDKDVEDAPFFEQIVEALSYFISDSILAGYNIRFDISFLNNELKKIQYPIVTLPALDVLIMARKMIKGLTRYNLETVSRYLKVKISRLHRALDDAYLTAKVYECLAKELHKKGVSGVDEYLTLFGIENEFFKIMQTPKIEFLQTSLNNNMKIQIRYLDENDTVAVIIAQCKQFLAGNKSIKVVEEKSAKQSAIKVSRIISLDLF